MNIMKKTVFIVLALVGLAALGSCSKESRCECLTVRGTEKARSLVPMEGISDCADLNKDWEAADGSGDIIVQTCKPEVIAE